MTRIPRYCYLLLASLLWFGLASPAQAQGWEAAEDPGVVLPYPDNGVDAEPNPGLDTGSEPQSIGPQSTGSQSVVLPQPPSESTSPAALPILPYPDESSVPSLTLVGAQALTPQIATALAGPLLRPTLSTQAIDAIGDRLDAWYLDNGYALSRVVGLMPDPDGNLVVEVVEPVVGEVAIQFLDETGSGVDADGNPVEGRTKESIILRELETEPGTLFNRDTVTNDLTRLSGLGVFETAAVAVDVEESAAPPMVDVTYRLQEQLSRSFRLGGGVSTELGLFGSVNFGDGNFRGRGDALRFGAQVGGRGINFDGSFTSPYRDSQPNRLGYRFDLARQSGLSRTFSDEVLLANGDEARERRFGGGAAVMRPLGNWDAELGINYARTSIRDEDGDRLNEDELGNQLTISDSGTDDLLTLGFGLTQDRRINPANPSDGSVLSLRTDQSVPVGSGSILMNRLQANYARFVPVDLLGAGRLSNPEVFAFNLQAGTVLGDLPPYEAFDLGGTNSVRGYGTGDVGSGRSYVLASAEYRFPIYRFVGGVLFIDIGTDLGTGSDVQGDPAGVRDKPGTGLGYGVGLRFGSPVGLIRADFGLNDDGDSRFHFGFGQRF
ncbi:MAG: BamA/TamA family outer membrane protein [Cyanobacteria bacterium P01_A01_bin.135]